MSLWTEQIQSLARYADGRQFAAQIRETCSPKVTDSLLEQTIERRIEVLDAMPGTAREIQDKLCISKDAVRKHLIALRLAGLAQQQVGWPIVWKRTPR